MRKLVVWSCCVVSKTLENVSERKLLRKLWILGKEIKWNFEHSSFAVITLAIAWPDVDGDGSRHFQMLWWHPREQPPTVLINISFEKDTDETVKILATVMGEAERQLDPFTATWNTLDWFCFPVYTICSAKVIGVTSTMDWFKRTHSWNTYQYTYHHDMRNNLKGWCRNLYLRGHMLKNVAETMESDIVNYLKR